MLLLAIVTALVISMVTIPPMIRLAPALGMVDRPNLRKVHAVPIPRVGGMGVATGAIASMLLLIHLDQALTYYLFGAIVLVCFGAWDDAREIGHYAKFIGQFSAAIAVVYWGGVWVSWVPLLGFPLPEAVGKPFTVFAIVGMINATNHSDGLDGLAGGESLMSLACLAYLGNAGDSPALVMAACAVMGGIFGFLRFNTHPAKVFMGDSGSQFLGFTLAVLAVLLTQRADPGLSMALPLLILGLPIVDILVVFAHRIYHRMNWFRATKNHIHHRLLELGFHHYEAVIIIYSIQAFFTLSAVWLSYQADTLILALYAGVCALVFILLWLAERNGWRVTRTGAEPGVVRFVKRLRDDALLKKLPILFIQVSIPIYFLVMSVSIDGAPKDSAIAMTVVAAILVLGLAFHDRPGALYLARLAIYGSAGFLVYLSQNHSVHAVQQFMAANTTYFIVLAAAIALALRFPLDLEFRATTMDFLIAILVVAAGLLSQGRPEHALGIGIIKAVLLLYGCELILARGSKSWNGVLGASAIAALGIIGLRLVLVV